MWIRSCLASALVLSALVLAPRIARATCSPMTCDVKLVAHDCTEVQKAVQGQLRFAVSNCKSCCWFPCEWLDPGCTPGDSAGGCGPADPDLTEFSMYLEQGDQSSKISGSFAVDTASCKAATVVTFNGEVQPGSYMLVIGERSVDFEVEENPDEMAGCSMASRETGGAGAALLLLALVLLVFRRWRPGR